jgi:hypothetical protein
MKVKKLVILKEEKQRIIKQLNELYEEENPTMQQTRGIKESSELDEKFLGLGVDWKNRTEVAEKLAKKFEDRASEYSVKSGKQTESPSWSKPGTPEFEMAVDAAIKFKTLDIVYHPGKKAFQPISYGNDNLGGFKWE